ncbi:MULTISPECIES: serine/threonine-protein kinase [Gordonia]|uniref:serine/threonine-protein kinase n=1 Tax=Gordonia TaxID=2053 RepID=UPI0030FE66B7
MGENTPSRVGETFGQYRLEELLGRGGMGEVYRAHDTTRDRDVALKLLNAQVAQDPTFQERFRRECQTLARLGEPHIIPIHDFGEISSTLFLDMRLVDGRDMRAVLRDRGALDQEEAVSLIEQVAAALDSAHEAGLVHRDVKPENVLVTDADFAYLVDFGVAHAADDTHLTHTGTAIGSVAYMSPEQFEDGEVGSASDVYSLAALFFELLTGRQPYPGESVSTVMRGVLLGDIPKASTVNPAVSEPMDAVLAWGLTKDPADRCPSAGDLARAARRALSGEAPDVAQAQTTIVPVDDAALTLVKKAPSAPADSVHGHTVVAGPNYPAAVASGPHRVASGPVPMQSGPVPVGAFPGQPYPYATGPVPTGRSTMNTALMVVIGILVAALIGGGAWLAADSLGSKDSSTTQAGGSPTDVADVDSQGEQTVTETAAPTPTYTPGPPPADNQECYDGVGTGYPQWTGCEFARNVRDSYVASGPLGESRTINGWAPQQARNYVMECGPYAGIVACRGGNQAVVYIY